jgi:hypothetical protein
LQTIPAHRPICELEEILRYTLSLYAQDSELREAGLQDNLIYQSSYDQWAREVNPDSVAPNGAFKPDQYIFGPRFFDAIERFPQGTPITYGMDKALLPWSCCNLLIFVRAQPRLRTARLPFANRRAGRCREIDVEKYQSGFL